jgi:hypothetical protein
MEMCMEFFLLCASDQQNYGKKTGRSQERSIYKVHVVAIARSLTKWWEVTRWVRLMGPFFDVIDTHKRGFCHIYELVDYLQKVLYWKKRKEKKSQNHVVLKIFNSQNSTKIWEKFTRFLHAVQEGSQKYRRVFFNDLYI